MSKFVGLVTNTIAQTLCSVQLHHERISLRVLKRDNKLLSPITNSPTTLLNNYPKSCDNYFLSAPLDFCHLSQ